MKPKKKPQQKLLQKSKAVEITLEKYEIIRKEASKAATKTAEEYVPVLYDLLKDAGLMPDEAREKIEEDCPFWSSRWIREYLPEEALHKEMRRIKKGHAEDKAAKQKTFEEADAEEEATAKIDEEWNPDDKVPTVRIGKDAIISNKFLKFHPANFNIVIVDREDYEKILMGLNKNIPALDTIPIDDIELEHDGEKIIDFQYKR